MKRLKSEKLWVDPFMKTRTLSILITAFALLTQTFGVGFSSTNSGVYLGVAGWRQGEPYFIAKEPFRYDDGLVWTAFCHTGTVRLNFPDRTKGIKLRLVDQEGKE